MPCHGATKEVDTGVRPEAACRPRTLKAARGGTPLRVGFERRSRRGGTPLREGWEDDVLLAFGEEEAAFFDGLPC